MNIETIERLIVAHQKLAQTYNDMARVTREVGGYMDTTEMSNAVKALSKAITEEASRT